MTSKRTLLFLALTFSFNCIFSASTWTWVGSTNSNYDTKSNWSTSSSSSRPQNGDDVIINSGAPNQPQLTANRTIKNITINGGTFDTRAFTYTVSTKTTVNGGSITNTHSANTGRINTQNFEINKSGVLSLTSNGILLVTVSGVMTFTNGIVESTFDDLIIISDNATVSGADNESHVNGPVRKVGNDAFTFPIGNASVYAPIGISDFSSSSNTQYATAYYTATAPVGTLSGSGILSSKEYWVFTRANVSQTSKITIAYDAAQRSGGITDSSDLAVAVFNGSNWLSINGAATGTRTVGNLTTSVRASGLITAVTFSSPLGLNPLPIELLDFKAKSAAGKININWSTITETNNDYFTVEKSVDGKVWSSIATLEGAKNSNMVLNYQTADATPVNGLQYYRLKQTDINGASTYSAIVPVNFNHKTADKVSFYPNPVNNILNIKLDSEETDMVSIVLMNAMGQTVMEMNNVSGHSFTLDVSSLENGVYFLEVARADGISKTKIIKN